MVEYTHIFLRQQPTDYKLIRCISGAFFILLSDSYNSSNSQRKKRSSPVRANFLYVEEILFT